MDLETSPFNPGRPATADVFTGRSQEVGHLRGMVKAAARGKFQIGYISGERGIGKSSLAAFVRYVAQRESEALGCHVFLGGTKNLEGMLQMTFNRLLKESVDKSWHKQVLDFFGSRVRSVGLFGTMLELDLTDDDLSALAHNFVPTIKQLLNKIKDQKTMFLLILDDINGLANSDVFANWLKSTVDEIGTSQEKVPLCILVVGHEERRQQLISNQPSLARVFELIDVAPWPNEEVKEFYHNSFVSADAKVTVEGMQILVEFTGGLPVLAHEIGNAVWRSASSTDISSNEIGKGIVNAAEIIGRKLLNPQIFSAIRSERYRSILRKMSDQFRSSSIRRSELAKQLNEKEKRVMDNFLQRMKGLGALESDPEVHGGYRFPNRLYELYFFIESQRMKAESRTR